MYLVFPPVKEISCVSILKKNKQWPTCPSTYLGDNYPTCWYYNIDLFGAKAKDYIRVFKAMVLKKNNFYLVLMAKTMPYAHRPTNTHLHIFLQTARNT